jgi:hypothetical protein
MDGALGLRQLGGALRSGNSPNVPRLDLRVLTHYDDSRHDLAGDLARRLAAGL